MDIAYRKGSEPLPVTLTQNAWVKILERDPSRESLRLFNEDTVATETARFLFPVNTTPWALTFDGAADLIAMNGLATNATWQAATSGCIRARIRATTETPSAARTIVAFGDANAEQLLEFVLNASGQLAASCIVGGTTQWTITSSRVVTPGSALLEDWLVVDLRHNGTRPSLWINNSNIDVTDTVSTDLTAWMADLSGIDVGRIGCRSYNSGGNENFFLGDIDLVRVSNVANPAEGSEWLSVYYIDEGSGATAADSGSVGADGTITTATWAVRSTGWLLPANSSVFFSARDKDVDIKQELWMYTAVATPPPITVWVGHDPAQSLM